MKTSKIVAIGLAILFSTSSSAAVWLATPDDKQHPCKEINAKDMYEAIDSAGVKLGRGGHFILPPTRLPDGRSSYFMATNEFDVVAASDSYEKCLDMSKTIAILSKNQRSTK